MTNLEIHNDVLAEIGHELHMKFHQQSLIKPPQQISHEANDKIQSFTHKIWIQRFQPWKIPFSDKIIGPIINHMQILMNLAALT